MALINDDNYYYDIVRINIRKFRKSKKYTQAKLAEEADISLDYLAEIESMKRKKSFSLAVLGRIADTLNIPIEYFFKIEKQNIMEKE